jgi:hypothetical protein
MERISCLAVLGTADLLQFTYINFPAGILRQGTPSTVVISVYPSPLALVSIPNAILLATTGLVNLIVADTGGSTMSPALTDSTFSNKANSKIGYFMLRI